MIKEATKLVSVLVILGLLIPQVTFAAWWNPFTWKIFNKSNNQTQILEDRVKELEARLATTTPPTTTPVIRGEVEKVIHTVDNSATIRAQEKARAETELKAQADQEALIAKQKAEEQARLDAIKARQAVDIANEEARQERFRIEAETQRAQEKLGALDAVNLKIAKLNAKYAEDMKICNSSGGTVSGATACKNAKTNRYYDDYNALMAEWQLIKYSN